MPANRPATDRTQSLRPLFSWMTSTPPRAFGASAHAACSSPCGPAQVIGVVGSACSPIPGGGALEVAGPGGGHRGVRGRLASGSRCRRRSGRWPPRCRPRAAPAGAGLRVWTTGRQRDRWRFLRRYSAVRVSHSRVCPYGLDSGWGCAARSRGGGRRRHPRRRARHRRGARRSRRDGDLHRPQQRVRQRAVRLRPSGNHRGDRRTGHRHSAASASRSQVDHLDIAQVRRLADRIRRRPRRASTSWSTTSGAPRCSRVGPPTWNTADLGTRPRRRAAHPAARHRHPPHHRPLPAAAAGRRGPAGCSSK